MFGTVFNNRKQHFLLGPNEVHTKNTVVRCFTVQTEQRIEFNKLFILWLNHPSFLENGILICYVTPFCICSSSFVGLSTNILYNDSLDCLIKFDQKYFKNTYHFQCFHSLRQQHPEYQSEYGKYASGVCRIPLINQSECKALQNHVRKAV